MYFRSVFKASNYFNFQTYLKSKMNSSHRFFYLLVICCTIGIQVSHQVDQTLEPFSKGYEVALAVIRKLYRSGIFTDEFYLTHRVANIASNFGEDLKSYQDENPSRGIWQISELQFNETLINSNLTSFRTQIAEKFPSEIGNWELVSWEDMLKPLHNGLAFRLYLETLPKVLNENREPYFPSLLQDQADYYKTYFNSSTSSSQFINKTLEFESNRKCSTEMDIVFVQDASCTVGDSNFTDALDFFVSLVDSFTFNNIRVGHVVYSSEVLPIFSLDNNFTQDELREKILTAERPDKLYTHTGAGLDAGLKFLQSATPQRRGVSKVIISITDGASIDLLDEVTNSTLLAGVNTFAIGLAYGWTDSQLLAVAHNQPDRVIKNGYTFSLISDVLYRSSQDICSVPYNLSPNVSSNATIGLGHMDKRYYRFNLSQIIGNNGLNVSITVSQGDIRSFYSYSDETPSSALYDGQLLSNGSTLISKLEGFEYVFIVVEGMQSINSYLINTIG